MVLFRERVFFSLETEPEKRRKLNRKKKKKRRKLNQKKKKETEKRKEGNRTKKEKKKKRKKKMAGPNGNESNESNGSKDTTRDFVKMMDVADVEYDIGAQVRESYSSWLLCRESADLGSSTSQLVSK